ncbi:hypothetical protein ACFE04_032004 [Oxalis oulophora]
MPSNPNTTLSSTAMKSPSSTYTNSVEAPPSPSSNTTFIQADPSTFREIVQKLTGVQTRPVSNDTLIHDLTRPRMPKFKLHERRQTAAKSLQLQLQLNLNNNNNMINLNNNFSVSPVSTLDFFGRRRVTSPVEVSGGRKSPELLTLFPLHSPREHERDDHYEL